MNRDDIIQHLLQAADETKTLLTNEPNWPLLMRFAALVAAHEREACGRIADSYGGPKEPMMVGTYEAGWHNAAEAIAADIRARGEV